MSKLNNNVLVISQTGKMSNFNIHKTSDGKKSGKVPVLLNVCLGILLAISCLAGSACQSASNNAVAKNQAQAETATQNEPDKKDTAAILANRALNEVKLANMPVAESLSQAALKLNDQLPLALGINGYSKGLFSNKKEDYETARSSLEKAAQIEPQNGLFQAWLVDIYTRLNQEEMARNAANKALTLFSAPSSDIDYFARGKVSSYLNKYDEAIQDFNKAVEINPQFAIAYNNRGSIYQLRNEYDLALKDLSKAIEINPQFAIAYFNRGITYYNKKDPDSALKEYNKTIELLPQFAVAYRNRGRIYIDKKNYEQAIQDYTKIIELQPQEPASYEIRADLYEKTDNKAAALADRQKYKELGGK